jgi:3-hydroxyisobutyrate dehydrogenase
MKIGYIGLGALGNEIARRFLAAHELWVWDLDVDAVSRLGQAGARVADSATEVGREADVILTCLPRSADVRELLFGSGGLAAALAPGKLVIDQTSGVPQETREMARRLGEQGVALLDAAVSGSPHVIPQGLATILTSGPAEAVDRALPVLRVISETVFRCGTRVGDGQAMKMVNNTMNAGCRLGTLEIVALARKAGLSLECITNVLNRGGGANLTTERMLPAIAQGKSATNFALSLMLKDLNQAVILGMNVGVPTPVASAVRSLLQIGANTLGPQAPLEGMIGVIESMAGTRLASSGKCVVAPGAAAGAQTPPTGAVGVVGADAVGAAIAKRLAQSGALQVHDGGIEPRPSLHAGGATATPDLDSLARNCGVIVLCLSTPMAAREALFGARGLAAGLSPDSIVVDLTLGDPDGARRTASDLAAFGATLVDAAMIGSPEDIAAGRALILSAGAPEACERVLPVFARIASNVIHCGGVGSAQTARIVNTAVAVLCRQVTYEGVVAGLKYGLQLHDMAEILTRCSGWSAASREVLPALVSGRAVRGQRIRQVSMELHRLAALAIRHGAPTTILNAVRSMIETAANRFGDDADIGDMFWLVRNASGLRFSTT